MALLQQFGRLPRTHNTSKTLRGGVSPLSLARDRSALAHGHHSLTEPGIPRRSAPPCIASAAPPDAAEVAADRAPTAPLTEAATDAAPAADRLEDLREAAATGTAAAAGATPDVSAAFEVVAPFAAASIAHVATPDADAAAVGEGASSPSPSGVATEASTSTSSNRTPWPDRPNRSGSGSDRGGGRSGGRGGGRNGGRGDGSVIRPPYAHTLTSLYSYPRPKLPNERPGFLSEYPVPPGKTFNVNSFLGRRDPHGGQYLVPEREYSNFLASYVAALGEGYLLYLTENYHQHVYKYFLELDWDWDTDLALVMEVTPQIISLATRVASDFYRLPHANVITSIRTPYKIHLNFPQLLTTELLACLCRDRLLEECVAALGPKYGSLVEWERLIDFPHGSLRLLGSRKAPHMDSDPAWVREKAYHPARLRTDDGGDGIVSGGGRLRWQPGYITLGLVKVTSIFPQPHQVAAFERSPAYLDMIFTDLEAYQKKMEERRQERARRRAEREQQQELQPGGGSLGPQIPNLPPGSRHNPLYIRLEVQPDETVSLRVTIKSRFRHKDMRSFKFSHPSLKETPADAAADAAAEPAVPDRSAAADAAAVVTAEHAPAADGAAIAAPTATAEAAIS